MKEQNNAFLRMVASIIRYVRGTESLMAIPAATTLVTKIDETNVKMNKQADLINAEDKTLAATVEKENEKVVGPLFSVVKALEIISTKKKDPSIVANLRFTRTELQRASCKTIETYVKSVLTVAREHTPDLAIYNITEEVLSGIETNTQKLVTASDALAVYQVKKKEEIAVLEQQMDETKDLLTELDMVAEIVCLTNPPAYKGYLEVRNKKETPEQLFTITVLNSATGRPEENARVLVQSTTRTVKDQPYVLLDRKTGKTGKVRNNKREFDIYKMTVEKLGCQTYTQTFTVADNNSLQLEVMLRKIDGLN